MSTGDPSPGRCPRCGHERPAGATSAVCPACALEAALRAGAGAADAGVLSLHDIPQPGERVAYLGDYELESVIAQGGMGVVYRARQRSLNRVVALKLLLGGACATEEYRRRFRTEAETAATLQHPHLVTVYEVGEHEGLPFFSMEYVDGVNLADRTREQPLPPTEAAKVVRTIAEAIQYAHDHGVLHRDLKPSNILLGADGRPRVTDFGLARQLRADARLSLSHQVLGTPAYMSPEQAAGRRDGVGQASDVYGLGAVLYHLVTARPPFLADSMTETLRQVAEAEPASPRLLNPDVPRDLDTIILKCLAKEPARRYASAQALADDLGRWLEGRPILARPASVPERVAKWYRRQPLAAWLATTVVVTIITGALVSGHQARTARTEAAKSREVAGFLRRMLEGVRPAVALGRDTQMLKEILDTAAQRVASELGQSPAVDAEIRHILGRSYSDLGDYTNAVSLLTGALDRRRQARIDAAADERGEAGEDWRPTASLRRGARHRGATIPATARVAA